MDSTHKLVVHVIPRSSADKIVEIVDGRVRIKVAAPPVEGKSNKRVIEILSKALDVPKSRISIIRGHKSRIKTLVIENLSTDPYVLIAEKIGRDS